MLRFYKDLGLTTKIFTNIIHDQVQQRRKLRDRFVYNFGTPYLR